MGKAEGNLLLPVLRDLWQVIMVLPDCARAPAGPVGTAEQPTPLWKCEVLKTQ